MHGCNLRRFTKFVLLTVLCLSAIQTIGISPVSYAAEGAGKGSQLHNPFCPIATYVRRDILTQGQARIEPGGAAVIYLGREEAEGNRAYRDFLMAHECCHHTRGHLLRLQEKGRKRIRLSLSSVNRSLELDADCCAGVTLAKAGRMDAIREAALRMRSFGAMPTGSGAYPAGDLRAKLIEDCAVSGINKASSEQDEESDPVE